MNLDVVIPLAFAGLAVWGAILWIRGKVQPHTLLAVAAVSWGLMWGGVGGIGHTIGVIGAAVKNNKPYDYRLVSLITTGCILMATGLVSVAISRWIKQGRPWALSVSAGSALIAVLYLFLLHPIQGSARLDAAWLPASYLCLLLMVWNPRQESLEVRLHGAAARSVMQRGAVKLALFGWAIQLVLASAYLEALQSGPRNVLSAAFVEGPAYGALLALAFSLFAFAQGRAFARRLSGHRFEVQLAWLALPAVLATAAFRMALVVYLEAAARRGLHVPVPSAFDALVYGAMVGALITGARWDFRRQSRSRVRQVSPAAS